MSDLYEAGVRWLLLACRDLSATMLLNLRVKLAPSWHCLRCDNFAVSHLTQGSDCLILKLQSLIN